jgi:hypothetical protein
MCRHPYEESAEEREKYEEVHKALLVNHNR